MNVLYPSGTRTDPLDRNPLVEQKNIQLTAVGPHAATTRLQYTVPAGRRLNLRSVYIEFNITTVATTPGTRWIGIQIDTGAGLVPVASLYHLLNVVNNYALLHFPIDVLLNPGNVLYIRTLDTSTGGQGTYIASLATIEFDA